MYGAPPQGLHIPDSLPELQREGEGGSSVGHNGVATATSASATLETPLADDGAQGEGETETAGGSRKRRKTDNAQAKAKAKWHFPAAGSGSGGAGGGDREGKEGGGRAGAGAGGGGAPSATTAILHHPLCLEHHSCPPIRRSSGDPPPENVKRLEVIYDEVRCGVGIMLCVWSVVEGG